MGDVVPIPRKAGAELLRRVGLPDAGFEPGPDGVMKMRACDPPVKVE